MATKAKCEHVPANGFRFAVCKKGHTATYQRTGQVWQWHSDAWEPMTRTRALPLEEEPTKRAKWGSTL